VCRTAALLGGEGLSLQAAQCDELACPKAVGLAWTSEQRVQAWLLVSPLGPLLH